MAEAIAELEKNGKYTFQLDGGEAVVEATDVEIFSEDIPGWLVAAIVSFLSKK